MKKIKLIGTLVLISLVLLILQSCATRAVYVARKPPAKKVEVKAVKPTPNAIWIQGHWQWNIRLQKYVWVKGYWMKNPKGKHWIPGYWKNTPRGWIWLKGHWK